MRSKIIALALALATAVAIPTAAFAGDRAAGGAAAGAATGAATGAIIGGPVGAAVGAGVGGVVGASATPDRKVRTYVTEQDRPSVAYTGDVVVGEPLPQDVEVYSVPDSDYSYTVVNKRRYIVDSHRKVIETVE